MHPDHTTQSTDSIPSNSTKRRAKYCGQNLHNIAKMPEYNIWTQMKQRCANANMPNYAAYGGRGIAVCDRWRESFENFITDMGVRPGKDYSLDRIDNDGPYSPENCRWATRIEQGNNTRTNRWITYNGKTMTLSEWSRKLNIAKSTLRNRFKKGWSVERAFSEPIQMRQHREQKRSLAPHRRQVAT